MNATSLKVRLHCWQLNRWAALAVRVWGAHVKALAAQAYPSRGQAARLAGPVGPGAEPDSRQKLLSLGVQQLDSTMAHVAQAYQGSARLLTFAGGQPLPWSAMVLARTAFEGALRILDILDPTISDDLRLARIAASGLTEVAEAQRLNADVAASVASPGGDTSLVERRSQIESCCLDLGITCGGGSRGSVLTPAGESAPFPLNIVDSARAFWDPVGPHAYRWLSVYTHGSSRASKEKNHGLAAVDMRDAFAIYSTVTEAVWMAMDLYARWVGFHDGLVMRLMRRVKNTCAGGLQRKLLQRPATSDEEAFLAAASWARDSGFMGSKSYEGFVQGLTRRL
jgi:hypothetical protein